MVTEFSFNAVLPVDSSGVSAWDDNSDWLSCYTQNADNDTAFGYDRINNVNSFANNGTIQDSNTSATNPSVSPSSMTIGFFDTFSGHFTRIAYYPTRVSDEALEVLTS